MSPDEIVSFRDRPVQLRGAKSVESLSGHKVARVSTNSEDTQTKTTRNDKSRKAVVKKAAVGVSNLAQQKKAQTHSSAVLERRKKRST